MHFTNNRNFPTGIKNFLEFNDYTPGAKTDISVTKLIGSPLIASLWKEHGKNVVEDNADRLWSAVGSGIHKRFEDANASDASMLMEKRFYADIPFDDDKIITISGQIDAYDFSEHVLADLKTSGAYKLVLGDKSDWEAQLNVNRWLMVRNGFHVETLQIWNIARDWNKSRTKDADYPEHPISVIEIDMWSLEETERYIMERIALHFGDEPKNCTDAERWAKPAKFAVMKKGRKSALRLLPTKEKAESWIETQAKDQTGVYIEERPAEFLRCESYCPFKSMGVCPNYQ